MSANRIAAHKRFTDAVRTHEPVLRGWIGARRSEAEKVQRDRNGRTKPPSTISLDGMPQFRHVPESLGESVYGILYGAGIMVLLNTLLFAGALVSFLRYGVR